VRRGRSGARLTTSFVSVRAWIRAARRSLVKIAGIQGPPGGDYSGGRET